MSGREVVHLELMSKGRLVQIARAEHNRAEYLARSSNAWRDAVREVFSSERPPSSVHEINAGTVTWQAEQILRRLPRDPDAAEHRRVLVEHAIHPLNRIGRRQEAS